MPPKAEYWTLTKEQFDKTKAQISVLGERLLNNLQQEGFTKIKSSSDWLGLTVEKKSDDLLTFVAFSLNRESPLEFRLLLRKWNINNPLETCVDLYEKTFYSLEEFESSFSRELVIVKEVLRNNNQE